MRAFGRIEKNPALTLPERHLDLIIPVNASALARIYPPVLSKTDPSNLDASPNFASV